MTKEKMYHWCQNIEYIFTENKLIDLINEGYIDRIQHNNRYYYYKKGCKEDILKNIKLEIKND